MEKYYPVVCQALAGPGWSVYAYFTDGKITQYDVSKLIEQGGVFERLADERFFNEAITVLNSTVAWDVSGCYDPTTCIDLDPFVLYGAQAVADPLENAA